MLIIFAYIYIITTIVMMFSYLLFLRYLFKQDYLIWSIIPIANTILFLGFILGTILFFIHYYKNDPPEMKNSEMKTPKELKKLSKEVAKKKKEEERIRNIENEKRKKEYIDKIDNEVKQDLEKVVADFERQILNGDTVISYGGTNNIMYYEALNKLLLNLGFKSKVVYQEDNENSMSNNYYVSVKI